MNQEEIIDVARQAILIALQVGAPILLIGLAVGVTIALFQALTQLSEMTLVFVPKILAVFLSLFFLMPYMIDILIGFTNELFDRIISLG